MFSVLSANLHEWVQNIIPLCIQSINAYVLILKVTWLNVDVSGEM